MRRSFARLLASCFMAAAWQIAAAAPVSDPASDELLRAATEILQKADADRASELWDSGSSVLKNRMSKVAFVQATRKARLSMGAVTGRDWSSVTRLKYQADNEFGFPAGLYANVVFSTQLNSGRRASEKISFAMESNTWAFTGYAVARETPDTPVAPAKPATQPSPPAASATPATPSAGIAEVEAAVRAWASAWSAQDMDRYLAAYAPGYTPARGQSRKQWEEERRARITGKSSIGVTLDDLVISVTDQTASARFRQNYRADKLREVSRKTLELQRSGNQWLIHKESTGG